MIGKIETHNCELVRLHGTLNMLRNKPQPAIIEAIEEIQERIFSKDIHNSKDVLSWMADVQWIGVPHIVVDKSMPILDALIESKLCPSKRDARELIQSKGIRLNGELATLQSILSHGGWILKKRRECAFVFVFEDNNAE